MDLFAIETLFAYVFYLVNLEHGLGLRVLLYKSFNVVSLIRI